VWLGFDWDWRHHHLIHWEPGHERPRDWWQRPPDARRKEIAAPDLRMWRPATRSAPVIVSGRNRGFEAPRFSNSFLTPKAPHEATRQAGRPAEASRVSVTVIGRAPNVGRVPEVSRAPDVRRVPEASRAPDVSRVPQVSHPIERREPAESAFGGPQSSHEVRASSSRGQESRGSVSSGSSHSGGSSGTSSGSSHSGGSSGRH
jgi:uncharacterized membrane protein YgcG